MSNQFSYNFRGQDRTAGGPPGGAGGSQKIGEKMSRKLQINQSIRELNYILIIIIKYYILFSYNSRGEDSTAISYVWLIGSASSRHFEHGFD